MKIAFTGAQSTGKTTLVYKLKELEYFSNYECCDNITRRALQQVQQNYPGVEYVDDLLQTLIIKEHLSNLQLENFLADRCLIDCYVYGMYQYLKGCLSEDVRLKMVDALDNVSSYDYIFYVEPEFGVIHDGVRSDDPVFQEVISYLFTGLIAELRRKYNLNNIYKITGSVEERITQILDILQKDGVK